MSDVRVRFAPSPTGNLHIGGARTAIFNYLFAKNMDGKFLIRIEDTDVKRSKPEYTEEIFAALDFLGISPDEKPIYQSHCSEAHKKAVDGLVKTGNAYYCFCDPQKLAEEKKIAEAEKRSTSYPGHCRHLAPQKIEENLKNGLAFAVRFKVTGEEVSFADKIHKTITVSCDEIEDFIIQRRDGTPTYMLAVAVDDRDMGITHIIRGDDHISNTPKQILLHRALNNVPPVFAHVPLIMGPDKKRLSKRHGAEPVTKYKKMGILGDAVVNYLVLLGWYPGEDVEVLTLDWLKENFSLEGVSGKSAVFDAEKLKWINGKHFSSMSDEEFIDYATSWQREYHANETIEASAPEYLRSVLSLAKSRVQTIEELFTENEYYFQDPVDYDEKGVKKHLKYDWVIEKLAILIDDIKSLDSFTELDLEDMLRQRAGEWEISAGKLIHPIRLALTGKTSSPGLFELMVVFSRHPSHLAQ
ncbi:MAG: glutamate--tRNA ligase [FCB group bacterium]|nr:glutamate--tRNA ligase [FCB group bacterium]